VNKELNNHYKKPNRNQMRNLFLIALLSISTIAYGKLDKKYCGNWILYQVQTLDSISLENNLAYSRIRINSDGTVDLYDRHIFDEFKLSGSSYKYAIIDNKLQIETNPITEFITERVSEKELILLSNNKRYFFNKLLIKEGNIFKDTDYRILIKDTLKLINSELFRHDIFKHFTTNIKNNNQSKSFVIDASFILRKNKHIDSIYIKNTTDSSLIREATSLIKASQKKWDPASSSITGKPIDSRVYIKILFKSSELNNLDKDYYFSIGSKLFNRALLHQNNNQNELAEDLYTDYISLYEFIIYNQSRFGYLYIEKEKRDYNSALFNRAALRIKLGKVSDACLDFESILKIGIESDVDEAKKYIESYCK
jgi:hypothetical protein